MFNKYSTKIFKLNKLLNFPFCSPWRIRIMQSNIAAFLQKFHLIWLRFKLSIYLLP